MKLNNNEESFLRAYAAIKNNKENLGIVYTDLLYKLLELERRKKDDWFYDLMEPVFITISLLVMGLSVYVIPEFIKNGTFVSYTAMLCLISIDIVAAFIDVKIITKTFLAGK